MRYPEFLKPNDSIGFIAPSFGCNNEPYKSCFNSSLDYFTKKSYKCVQGPNCFADNGFGKSNTPEACAAEINEFFTDESLSAIISCGGGETMCEDLTFVDFDKISKAKPKWYMGYSDNTNLTFVLPTLCDTAAIYGPCAPAFGQGVLHPAVDDALEILSGKKLTVTNYDKWEKESLKTPENPFVSYNVTEPFNIKYGPYTSENGTQFEGRLIGGCLDVLVCLCGTKFDNVKAFNEKYADDGIVWFLESCELNPFAARRALWQLKNAGWFDSAKGFLVGRAGTYTNADLGFAESLEEFGVPVLLDLDIGHLPPMMPLISGAYAKVFAKGNTFSLRHELC